MEKYNKSLIGMVIIGILLFLSIGYFIYSQNMTTKCESSRYNPSNVTGAVYLFGNCYAPYYGVYESKEKCGFLGISCRTVEPYTKMYDGSVCFKLNGELC